VKAGRREGGKFWGSFLFGVLAIVVGCDSAPKSAEKPREVKPAPLTPNPAPVRAAVTCEAVSPRLSAPETYVYAGIASYALPRQQRSDGTVRPVKRPTGDGIYNVITLQPEGGASGMFFSARRDEQPSFSETDAACWRWNSESAAGGDPPRELVVTLGEGQLQFARREGELLERMKDDKLRTARVYARVASPSQASAPCPPSSDALHLFTSSADRHAFVARAERGIRAVVIGREGGAAVIEIAVDGTDLTWNASNGCWSTTGETLRVTDATQKPEHDEYVADRDGLRQSSGAAGAARIYARAK